MNAIDVLSREYVLDKLNHYELLQDIDALTAPFKARMMSILARSSPVLNSEETEDGFKLTLEYDPDTNAMIAQLEALSRAAIYSYMRQRGISHLAQTAS